MLKTILLASLLALYCSVHAQTYSDAALMEQEYENLIELYDKNSRDTLLAKQIANVYIQKAEQQGDATKMARGYTRLAFVSKRSDAIKYLDTTITLSKNSTHPNYPAIGYIFKSYYLFTIEKYEESLQNAITGYQHAKEKKNQDQQITALQQINAVNELYGDYEKALETELLTKELLFENKESEFFTENHIASLEGIGNCYVRLQQPDSALAYYKKGIEEALKIQDTVTYHAFVSKTGTALYVKGDYNAALDSLQKGNRFQDYFVNNYDNYYNYYMGSIYFQQGNQQKGVQYFKTIDSIYEKKNVLYPELPVVYDRLANHYQQLGDEEAQLEYMRKLVLVVKLINLKRVFIKDKIAQEYEIPKLLEEKDELISHLENKQKNSQKLLLWVGGVLVVCLFALVYYIRRQQLFKKRFETLMSQQETNQVFKEQQDQAPKETLGISEEIVSEILTKLTTFEEEKGYLSKRVSLTQLADYCNTNSTYLSKVINFKKEKNFSSYLNQLRVTYAFNELKDNGTFRKYTIKAIAAECGFKSAESFSKAFYKKFGIYPSFYIKQLEQKA
ncbi:helix-turn-helix transcriptional regulator [Marinirhabdus gelatinilytica]|uniref:AraC-like DNA-binding protein n=1 Tax=Marinirhabdus gelatinilytica TaxID=1703343 RepID=A0A370QIG7_9FLAO|nr:helix-turn-helix transcriptional regulator [Marinirhabdus gelatinilytica]RDK88139.1 AraC-like DNA-binding protein [Marinirhabdus gelatinilytica]